MVCLASYLLRLPCMGLERSSVVHCTPSFICPDPHVGGLAERRGDLHPMVLASTSLFHSQEVLETWHWESKLAD